MEKKYSIEQTGEILQSLFISDNLKDDNLLEQFG